MNYIGNNYVVGTCYYPEHWDKSLWRSDLSRMLDAGITVIRIAEFAWSKIEPTEGNFTYEFFDEFLDLCDEMGMKVIVGTPTATPPAWLTEKYPEVLNADECGNLYHHGGRRHYNYNSPKYRELSSIIVEKMAEHYAKRDCVIGWQLDNELNCEISDFHSEADHAAFRDFLLKKYGSLDELNRAWGTAFWNQTYTDWKEVYLPRHITGGPNPHQKLDYYRFISDSVLSYADMQSKILRKYTKPQDFITTNGLFGNMDNHKMAKDSLDIYMYDSYPSFAQGLERESWIPEALADRQWSRHLTLVRSVCPHFGIMEQQSGANGWTIRMEGPAPRPGQLTLWAMQSVAHGADFISFFRWRTACIGTEIYWHGILDYDNRDNRKLKEVSELTKKLSRIDEVCGADYEAKFAYVFDYDNDWDCNVDSWHRRVDTASRENVFLWAQKAHMPYDMLYFTDESKLEELKKYPVLIYPHPVIMTPKRADLLEEYVKAGGTLVIGCRSGYKDVEGHCVMMPQPGLLSKITGSDVKEFTFVHKKDEGISADFTLSGDCADIVVKALEMPLFNDILTTVEGSGAKVVARYNSSYYKGEGALVENKIGMGRALHLGATFNEKNLDLIMAYLGQVGPCRGLVDVPEDIEVSVRVKDGKRYMFLLNYMFESRSVNFKKYVKNLETKEELCGLVNLKPFEVLVVEI